MGRRTSLSSGVCPAFGLATKRTGVPVSNLCGLLPPALIVNNVARLAN